MNAVIERIYSTGCVEDRAGHAQQSLTSPVQHEVGELLYQVVRERGFERTLEVGLAYGLSAMFICQAHQDKGAGAHLAIDPNQGSRYQSIGLLNMERAGLMSRLSFHASPSYLTLPELFSQGKRFDFAFIDGCHLFDFALLDFFYIDRLLDVGGWVAFDDLWMPAVRRVAAYVLSNRAYRVAPFSALSRSSWIRRCARIGRRVLQDPLGGRLALKLQPTNAFVLEKRAEDQRAWNFHRRF